MWQHIPFTAIFMLGEIWAPDKQHLFNMSILEMRGFISILCLYSQRKHQSGRIELSLSWAEKNISAQEITENYFPFNAEDTASQPGS